MNVGKMLNQKLKGKSHFTLKGVRYGGCLFLLYLLSCSTYDSNSIKTLISESKHLLQSGDVIVRNGRDEVSDVVRSFNRKDKTYSHCGIILVENDTVFVYHALGGVYNPSQALLREPIDRFCASSQTDKFAVYRYNLNTEQRAKLRSLVQEYHKNKLPFDLFFNYDTNDKMYCSEFVFKCLNHVLDNALSKYLTKGNLLYISIDDLYLNDMAIPVLKQ